VADDGDREMRKLHGAEIGHDVIIEVLLIGLHGRGFEAMRLTALNPVLTGTRHSHL
jgi:hypothetical protein